MKTEIQSAIKAALKNQDKVRLETLRGVLSAMQYEEIERKVEQLPIDVALGVCQREIKKRKEEMEFAEKANRPELIGKLQVEISVLEELLPAQLSAETLKELLNSLKAGNPSLNMGLAMKSLKETHAGQYDAKLASELAKQIFG